VRAHPSAQEVRAFVERHRGGSFPHADEALAAILQYADRLDVSGRIDIVPLRSIYRGRAEHLAKRWPTSTLARDVRTLADALSSPDRLVAIWGVTLPDGTWYGLFERESDRVILGSVKSWDRRIADRSSSDPE
jgi:hypothetical protein